MSTINYANRASSSIIYLNGKIQAGNTTTNPIIVVDTVADLDTLINPQNLDVCFIRLGTYSAVDIAIYYAGGWVVKSLKGFEGEKGEDGERGYRGFTGDNGADGTDGINGADGLPPEHRWDGTKLQFKLPNGTWGTFVDLKGDKGDAGEDGINGARGAKPNHEWDGTSLRIELPNGSWGPWVNLVGATGGIIADDLVYVENTDEDEYIDIEVKTCHVLIGEQEIIKYVRDKVVASPNKPGREISIVCMQEVPVLLEHHVGSDVPTLNHGFKLPNDENIIMSYGQIAKFKFFPLLGMYYLVSINAILIDRFVGDTPVILNVGESVGPWSNGDIIPTNGKTKQEAYNLLVQRLLVPTLIAPSLAITFDSYSSGFREVGSTFTAEMIATFNRGRINGKKTGGVWNASSLQNYRAGVATGYVLDGEDEQPTNSLEVSRVLTLGDNTFTGTVNFEEGAQPIDSNDANFGTPLASGSITASKIVPTIYPIFYGTLLPEQGIEDIDLSLFTKSLITASGTITIPYSMVVDKRLTILIPSESTSKTKWFVTEINKGSIGGVGDLFEAETVENFESPTGLWTSKAYKVYISDRTSLNVNLELRN